MNATFNDRGTSTIDNQIAARFLYAGPFASRPADLFGLAVGRTHVNSRVSAAERALGKPALTPEYVGELFYSVRLAHWVELRPGVQFIHRSGAVARNENQVIVGMRVSASL